MGNLFKMVTLQSPLWEREIESGVPLVRNPRRAMPSVREGSIMTPRAEDLPRQGWGRSLCRERQDEGAALWPLFIAPSEAFRTSPCLAAATPLLCPLGPDSLGDHPHTGVSQHQGRGHLPAQRVCSELPGSYREDSIQDGPGMRAQTFLPWATASALHSKCCWISSFS